MVEGNITHHESQQPEWTITIDDHTGFEALGKDGSLWLQEGILDLYSEDDEDAYDQQLEARFPGTCGWSWHKWMEKIGGPLLATGRANLCIHGHAGPHQITCWHALGNPNRFHVKTDTTKLTGLAGKKLDAIQKIMDGEIPE